MRLSAKRSHNRHVGLAPLNEVHRTEPQAACAADLVRWREPYPRSMALEHFDAGWPRNGRRSARGRTNGWRGSEPPVAVALGPDPATHAHWGEPVSMDGRVKPDHDGKRLKPREKAQP